MSTPEERRAQGRKAILTRHLGPDHPETIKAGRELIEAKAAAHDAEAARLRALLPGNGAAATLAEVSPGR